MRKLTVGLAVASIAVTASIAMAGPGAGTGINGSMHDINSMSGYTNDMWGRTCVFCHTPHNAMNDKGLVAENLVPLWNHAQTTLPTMRPYTWIAPTNAGINIAPDPLIGPSRLCMACHDGSTAVDSHGTAGSSVQGTTKMTSSYLDGLGQATKRFIIDLTVTHPIGFLYDEAASSRGDKEIVTSDHGFITSRIDPTTWNTQDRGQVTESAKKIRETLYGGYMTCATCHDVHNSVNAAPDAGHSYNYFLYAKEEGSAICLSCHKK